MNKASTATPRHAADKNLRFAMLGMIEGNGHPYSWSAIVNGYDPKEMASCPYPTIPVYLGNQPLASVKVPHAQVTHIWTDKLDEARLVAKASLIPNVVERPEDVIGQVDGVFISTDDGYEHVRRARPFVEAGIPVFIDKPLAISVKDLQTFIDWEKKGCPILSSSGARYMQGLDNWDTDRAQYGEIRWIASGSTKYWENYGIHAVQPLYRILGPGFTSVRMESQDAKRSIGYLRHKSGVEVIVPIIYDGGGGIIITGTKSQGAIKGGDTYVAFRRQMVAFVDFVRSGVKPYPFSETIELMAVLIAGLRSREQGSRRVEVSEIMGELRT